MSETKQMKLEDVWAEKYLCAHLGLEVTDKGRSRVLSGWIREGLRFIELGDNRYFLGSDVVQFFIDRRGV